MPSVIVDLPLFDPPVLPSPGTSIGSKPKLRVAEFGEGYSQIVRDGLNHIKKDLSLTWDVLTNHQADDIVAFFEERGGDKPFWFKPTNGSLMKWRCEEWTDKIADDGVRQITTTFIRSNTLEN